VSAATRVGVAVVVGTRPEAIKMAPVIYALKEREQEFQCSVISTAQHRHMLDQVLNVFDIQTDFDLNVMSPNQSLNGLTSKLFAAIDQALAQLSPDLVLVQGDTTTAFTAAVAAFHRKIPVGHVEAGLRSRDLENPFPEEANRRLVSVVADMHFAPTPLAMDNLLEERVARQAIAVTGNTVVDAINLLLDKASSEDMPLPGVPLNGDRLLLVTSHRRESWGSDLEGICHALVELTRRFPDVCVVYPVHLNPKVCNTVRALLGGKERIYLTAPLDYLTFAGLMRRSYLILTDSGGVQEEAPAFGKPVLVLRSVTERPEASLMGLAKIVGTSPMKIVREASRLLADSSAYDAMREARNPYGDGHAAQRIMEAISRCFEGKSPLLEEWQEFQSPLSAEVSAA
jgi:UDP-N-acetylglucosamine 2-epimerase (non-hydrolysing)